MMPDPHVLRVLHCIYDDPHNPWVAGGGSVRVFELYRRLTESVRVTVATGAFPHGKDEEREGVEYRRLGRTYPYAWSRATYAPAATRLLAAGDYDVAVFDFSVYTPLRIPLDRPIGVTVHHVTGPSAAERWGRLAGAAIARLERAMLRRARWFTATSRATYAGLLPLVREGAHVRLVQAGIPDDLFGSPRLDEGYLLYFGRLDWFQKGLDTLMSAAAILIRERPGLQLRIAGRGKDATRVTETASALGISSSVQMLGPVTEAHKRELFAGASVLMMPSRFEGFGMVAAEAMAAGVPIVASDAGSLPEVIDAPAGGRLVPVGDPWALATAVGTLLDSPAERDLLGASARVSAERFRWDGIAKEHLEFLRDIHRATRTGVAHEANG